MALKVRCKKGARTVGGRFENPEGERKNRGWRDKGDQRKTIKMRRGTNQEGVTEEKASGEWGICGRG